MEKRAEHHITAELTRRGGDVIEGQQSWPERRESCFGQGHSEGMMRQAILVSSTLYSSSRQQESRLTAVSSDASVPSRIDLQKRVSKITLVAAGRACP